MSHLHEMRDTDSHYTVDPISRTVNKGSNTTKSILIQNDHNSEILTFELPRYVEGHDMSLCNRVETHYINSSSATSQKNVGVYEIKDFVISEDDSEVMVWSWIIPYSATRLVGALSFAFRFACVADDGTVEYAWSTAPFSGISISAGIYNGEEVVEKYEDILAQWEAKLGVDIIDVKQTNAAIEPNGVNIVTLILSNGERRPFIVRNGQTPVRGVDYWTEEDKQEIINSILGVIPAAEEASF